MEQKERSKPNQGISPRGSVGSEDVYGAFTCYYQDLVRYVARRSRSPEDCCDIVQDTFLRLMKLPNPRSIRVPKSFLYRMAHNLLVDKARKRQVRERYVEQCNVQASDERHAEVSPHEAVIEAERRLELKAAIEALPNRCRECFILHLYGKLPHAEIADRLGISKSGVEKHLARAMSACRDSLLNRTDEPR